MRVRYAFILAAVGLAAASGCSKHTSEPQPGASVGDEAPPATGTTPMTKLSDGQIAQVLMNVDEGEIQQAQVALNKTNDPGVRAFATHMVQDHTTSKQAGEQLASRTGLKLADSPKAQELHQAGAQMLSNLNAADSNNFDITYIDGQIDEHSQVLKVIKDQLLPAVNDPALREHLNTARGMVEHHIDQAKALKKAQ